MARPDATVLLHCDNQGSISLTKDASLHTRSKHIDVAHHFVGERVEMNQVMFEYLPTHLMPADALTKAGPGPKLGRFRHIMGVVAR